MCLTGLVGMKMKKKRSNESRASPTQSIEINRSDGHPEYGAENAEDSKSGRQREGER